MRFFPSAVAGAVSLALLSPLTVVVPASAAGSSDTARLKAVAERAARSGADCASFDGLRYCLGLGFTTRNQKSADAALKRLAHANVSGSEQTGDVDTSTDGSRLTLAQRRTQFAAAAASVDKVRELTDTSTTSAARTTATSYPATVAILNPKMVSEQVRTYWCGPASMQMVAWNWQKTKYAQYYWARRLRTTTSGSSIWDLVRVTNRATGWDNERYAGKYIVLNIGDYSFRRWFALMKKHYATYRAPVILHPVLKKRYYSYLDDDASGHFQVGRGYDTRGPYLRLGYFEPWNQQRFDSSEPYIARRQWHRAFYDFQANKAHPAQNLGL